jgi:hypothetical protein
MHAERQAPRSNPEHDRNVPGLLRRFAPHKDDGTGFESFVAVS